MSMTNEGVLQLDFLPPSQILSEVPFLLPVIVTNRTKSPIDGQLSGVILLDTGLVLEPNQATEIKFERLDPGQKILLTWILYAKQKGQFNVHVQVCATNEIVATKMIRLVVSS